MSKKTIFLATNELNFEFIQRYIDLGHLKTFKYLFETFGYKETTSESEYKLLEPWIQWVTVHTGKTYAEHQIFRLGDIVNRPELKQLWEIAEEKGLSVGAISPFNAANRLRNAKFFVPDPWTKTGVNGTKFVRNLSEAVSQGVNDNAKGGITKKSLISFLTGFLRITKVSSYFDYLSLVSKVKSTVGIKAVVLDKILGDLFLHQWRKYRPDFSSVFLNTGAHIQHHYMFNSKAYNGSFENPEWYCPKGQDPLLLVLKEYDRFLSKLLKLGTRVVLSTGLHQKPHEQLTYYWRLREHAGFLKEIGITYYSEVFPRMSRDFLICFNDSEQASRAQKCLESLKSESDGISIFSIDNRGDSLFIELTYPKDIPKGLSITGDASIADFQQWVAFVAIKNGEHHGVGYVIDTEPNDLPEKFPLPQLFDHLVKAM